MMYRLLLVLCAATLTLTIGGCNALQVEARVFDESGNPIPNARVTANQFVYFMDFRGSAHDSGKTNKDGYVRLSFGRYEIPGSVQLVVVTDKSESWQTRVEFDELPAEISGVSFPGHTVKDPEWGSWSGGPIGDYGKITADLIISERH